MTAAEWKKFFSSIRPEEQSELVVTVTGGIEIAVAQISRPEEAAVLLRGRVQGQAEMNRVFIVPYANISVVYVNRVVLAEEVELYSPSTTPERKKEIARMVAEIEARNRDEARQAEAAKMQGTSGGAVPVDLRRQLDALKEMAQAAGTLPPVTPAHGGDAPKPLPAPGPVPPPPGTRTVNPQVLPPPQRANIPSMPKPK